MRPSPKCLDAAQDGFQDENDAKKYVIGNDSAFWTVWRDAAALMADASEFESTALPHMDAVYRAALTLCGRPDQAEDLVQTTYVKAVEHFGSFRLGTNCKAWLMRILRNTWIDSLRRIRTAGPTAPLVDEPPAPPTGPQPTTWSNADDLLENFSDEQVIEALRELPDDQRLTLYLVDVEELSQDQVAEITAVRVGTVKSRTSRARQALRGQFLEHAKDLHLAKDEP